MKIIRYVEELRQELKTHRCNKKVISFVPTMGYLHEGHLSLVSYAKNNSDVCVVSVFVNPTQFGPNEDFNHYPRDEERDIKLLDKENCDYVFIPEISEIYSEDFSTFVLEKKFSKILEGEFRPAHFEGVTTIVTKLFNIVQPDFAVFGQKDAQQALIIQKMVKDLNIPVQIEVRPIVREVDGLAMSSRNIYLSKEERKEATILYRSLLYGKSLIERNEIDVDLIKEKIKDFIKQSNLAKIDYVEIVEKDSFEKVKFLESGKAYFILLAVRIGSTRLIDNFVVQVS